MPYCSKCGVEVEKGVEKCPLCGTPIPQFDDKEKESLGLYPTKPEEKPKIKMTGKQKRIFAWEIVTIVLGTIAIILLLINIVVNKTVSWSLYPISSLIAAWLFTTFPLFLPKKPIIIVIGELLTLIGYLAALDGIDRKIQWFHRLALPIVAHISIVAIIVTLCSIKVKTKGANIAAFISFGIGTICLGIDAIVSSIIGSKFSLSWSLIVAIPLFIIGLFLIYVHYRFKNLNLKKRFLI